MLRVTVILPDELITEVLSFLPVRSLMRLKCVCKSWKTLFSDHTFVNLHLKHSARNKHIAIFSKTYHGRDLRVVSHVPMHRLLENTSLTIANDPYFDDIGYIDPVGSYNGLLCLFTMSEEEEYLLYLWNPATRSLSNKIEFFRCDKARLCHNTNHLCNCGFGYDNSTGTYKIVSLCQSSNEVRVLSIGDNVWRNIQSFPDNHKSTGDAGVYVNGRLNWMTTIRKQFQSEYEYDYKWKKVTINQFVIISLDLSTETYCPLLLPWSFDKVPLNQRRPMLAVLMDSLCFSHDLNGTYLIIWQMKEFGVQESWIQFLKISYQSLPIVYHQTMLLPLYLSENGETLILAWNRGEQAILYNLRDNSIEKTGIINEVLWFHSKDYVESLVSTNYESSFALQI